MHVRVVLSNVYRYGDRKRERVIEREEEREGERSNITNSMWI